jgi:hypothetical protein
MDVTLSKTYIILNWRQAKAPRSEYETNERASSRLLRKESPCLLGFIYTKHSARSGWNWPDTRYLNWLAGRRGEYFAEEFTSFWSSLKLRPCPPLELASNCTLFGISWSECSWPSTCPHLQATLRRTKWCLVLLTGMTKMTISTSTCMPDRKDFTVPNPFDLHPRLSNMYAWEDWTLILSALFEVCNNTYEPPCEAE